MGRPATKPLTSFKDGFYIEIRNKGSRTGIVLRRDTEKQMLQSAKAYEATKEVVILGESKNGKWVDDNKPKKKTA
ncbi:hypothetical protein ACFQ1M_07175 [Sungkyunkwania multivorans]|uniref:Uncharacterized protein n=1 Tax=Sungkyunkwania multivorans TaxID=1173618 RepID=A0ABW3CWH4_9FLAO